MSLHYRKCPICENEKKPEVLRKIKIGIPESMPIASEYNVVCCDNCGFTYADISKSQDDYNTYYRDYNLYSEVSELRHSFDDLYSVYANALTKYINYEDRICDIGCGSGDFLHVLKEMGFVNLFGIDPSEASISMLNKYGIDGSVANIFDNIHPDLKGSFDVIISTGVIEHIVDIDGYMNNISEYLSDKGKLLLAAPAVEGFEKYYYPIPNYFNHEHINYFSLTSLDNISKKHAFSRISSTVEAYQIYNNTVPELLVIGVYQKGTDIKPFEFDTVSSKSIKNYFVMDEEKNVNKRIRDYICESKDKVIIWGGGAFTIGLLQCYPEIRDKIECIVDNNTLKHGTYIHEIPVMSPESIKNTNPIIICSMLNYNEIVNQTHDMGLTNQIKGLGEKI